MTRPNTTRPEDRSELLGQELEALVVKAKEFSLDKEEVIQAFRNHWRDLRHHRP